MTVEYLRTGPLLSLVITTLGASLSPAQQQPAGQTAVDVRKAAYIFSVTRGEGLLPWQDGGVSEREREFRAWIEQRKDAMLAARTGVERPALLTGAQFDLARRNAEAADWARAWYDQQKELADHVVSQPSDYVERMIPELTPGNTYGFTCPNCVGVKSQEAVGASVAGWDHRKPDVLTCRTCGHVYPSDRYPETARLVCPRSGQEFMHYLNDCQREQPDDRTGRLAYHWVGYPIHVSFTGTIREQKVGFMISAARSLAIIYRFSGEPRYAERAIDILVRLADCYRGWLYHDYWDTIADCDPLYAAWHDKALPLDWKRHLCAQAYEKDSLDKASMLQGYWGAGRYHPSTGGISVVRSLALVYDLVHDARGADDRPLWTPERRARVERDLLLEFIMEAEPFVGGADQAKCVNNKAPRVYAAMAAVAKCLGLPGLADTALRGYEGVRDKSFTFDGYSHESPSYNNMYLSQLVLIPEELNAFRWPAGLANREGEVGVYATDERLRLMFRAMIDQLRPDGRLPPLSDSMVDSAPGSHLIEIGRRRYPEHYDGTLPALYRGRQPTEYAVFNLTPEQTGHDAGLVLPEICFPAWGTAILRHGVGPAAAMLTLSFNPPGGHRHEDNLSLFYVDQGDTILGDHGYVGDMPVNRWIHHTFSHNLVVVDDAGQQRARQPRLHRFVTSPWISVVEASSNAYPQCSDYRRVVALIKGPGASTIAVDIFHVKGGGRHAYRLFSELASSDAPDGALVFDGLVMPAEPPLPAVGASLAREDIFGLRDTRGADGPPSCWQATWRQADRSYRVWMLCPADRVEASNGPGQQTRGQAGRRVRYLDVIRAGDQLTSTFVAVHEPCLPGGDMPIRRVDRLSVSASAGPEAIALRIESAWGTTLVCSGFSEVAEVAGVQFGGAFGVIGQTPEGGSWFLASEASTLKEGAFGFNGAVPAWSGRILSHQQNRLTVDSRRPGDWAEAVPALTSYVLVGEDECLTGLPVRSTSEDTIGIERFPLPPAKRFRLPNVRFGQQQGR